MTRPTWDETWMSLAYLVSMRSIDPSSRIGAVAVAGDNSVKSVGYNGLPRGIDFLGDIGEDGLYERQSPIGGCKYRWTEHAERNCIFNAGRNETNLVGCTLYCTLAPCSDCARAIIQAGFTRLVLDRRGHNEFVKARGDDPNVWAEDHKMIFEMFSAVTPKISVDWIDVARILPLPEMFFSGMVIPVNENLV